MLLPEGNALKLVLCTRLTLLARGMGAYEDTGLTTMRYNKFRGKKGLMRG